jgi:uncharacterized protein (UPF0179 family)
MERGEKEPIQIICPKCRRSGIIYIPVEEMPRCPDCRVEMMIEELLDEGKSY